MAMPVRLLCTPYVFLSFVFCVFFSGSTIQAASLTTFENYAAMTVEEQSAVRAFAASVIYKRALEKNDEQQVYCLRQTFSSKYGPEMDVKLAHARLRGRLSAAVENPNPKGRVEYLVARHFLEVCPPVENLLKIDNE